MLLVISSSSMVSIDTLMTVTSSLSLPLRGPDDDAVAAADCNDSCGRPHSAIHVQSSMHLSWFMYC